VKQKMKNEIGEKKKQPEHEINFKKKKNQLLNKLFFQ